MNVTRSASGHRAALRLWPGVLGAIVVLLARFLLPLVWPGSSGLGILVGLAGFAIVLLWWLFASRAPWLDRILAVVVMAASTFLTTLIVHPSIAGGFMGNMVFVYAVPATLSLAFVGWAVAARNLPDGPRRATMVLAIVAGCAVWALLRTDGVRGEAGAQLAWRWSPTHEERLLAQPEEPLSAPPALPLAAPPPVVSPAPAASEAVPAAAPVASKTAVAPVDVPAAADPGTRPVWPGFRGSHRDGVVRNIRIRTDWDAAPPVQVWRRPIGPGWSSFAVEGDLVYTQEQRGEEEIVSSYRLSTGQPVWRHGDAARFYESNGGPGPRGTPTLHNGRVYTLGATAIVNALDSRTGSVVWSRNAQTDTGAPEPGWGFTSSPLVVDDRVIVATSGRLVAYDIATGTPRWTVKTRGGGYSSPHLATIGGAQQIVFLSGGGATGVAPADGTILWTHDWQEGVSIIQPAFTREGDLLIAAGDAMGGLGLRRLSIARPAGADAWAVADRWSTRGLKPYFNDFVVHNGHAYGFDGAILACVDLSTGERVWKGGRYGNGQMLLLAEQDLLLILSEDGEIALVQALPDKFTEVARRPAIDGKTWNHPVLVGDQLLVRNGEEMASFRLGLARR